MISGAGKRLKNISYKTCPVATMLTMNKERWVAFQHATHHFSNLKCLFIHKYVYS